MTEDNEKSWYCAMLSRSVVSDCETPWTVVHQAPLSRGILQARKRVGCHALLQGILPTQGSNPGPLHCRQILYQLNQPTWPILEFLPPGVFVVLSPFWMLGAPLGQIFWRGSHVSSLDPSGEIQKYPFPCKINFLDFHCLLNPSWYQMGRGRVVSFRSSKCFSAPVKISLCGKF